MKYNEKIVALRKANGFTQEGFARAVGVTRQAVYKWEVGDSYPEAEKLIAIKQLFGISIDDLLDDTYEVIVEKAKKPARRKTLPPIRPAAPKAEPVPAPVAEPAPVVEEPIAETPVEAVPAPLDEIPVIATEPVPAPAPVVEAAPVEEPAPAPVAEPAPAPVAASPAAPTPAPADDLDEFDFEATEKTGTRGEGHLFDIFLKK